MKSRVKIISLVFAALALVMFVAMLAACKSGKGAPTGQALTAFESSAGDSTEPRSREIEEVIAEIEGYDTPEGVDSEVFDELKAELVRLIEGFGTDRFASRVPPGDESRVSDLAVAGSEAEGFRLEWSYVNVGDYDFSSEITIADVAPIARNYLADTSDGVGDDELESWVDGNRDGEITIADVAPIARNYLARVAGYSVYGAEIEYGSFEMINYVDFSAGVGESLRTYSYDVGASAFSFFKVVPDDGAGEEGEPSIAVEVYSTNLFPPFSLTPADAFVDAPPFNVVYSVGLGEAIGVPITAEVIEVDGEGVEIAVVGALVDDGLPESGDETAGDRIYSFKSLESSAIEIAEYYRARVVYDPGEGEITLFSEIRTLTFINDITEERALEIETQIDDVGDDLEALSATMPVEDAALQLAESLRSDPNVSDAGITGSGRGVWWYTIEGIGCVVYIHAEGEKGGGGSSVEATNIPVEQSSSEGVPPNAATTGYTSTPVDVTRNASRVKDTFIGNKKVIAYAAFNDEFGGDDDVPEIVTKFIDNECPEYDVLFWINQQCDLDSFKLMSDYGVILISSHGDVTRAPSSYPTNEWVYIETRESYIGKIRGNVDLRQKRVFLAGKVGTGPRANTFAITPLFISHYCAGMPGSIVYMSTCHGANGPTMVSAFSDAGAAVYYGYSDYVQVTFSKAKSLDLFDKLLDGKNTSEAYTYDKESDDAPAEWLMFGGAVRLPPCFVGEWEMSYVWTGRGSGVTVWSLTEDGKYTDSTFWSAGTWEMNGSSFVFKYDCGTTYTGTIDASDTTMSGTMIEDPGCGGAGDGTGTWSARKLDEE